MPSASKAPARWRAPARFSPMGTPSPAACARLPARPARRSRRTPPPRRAGCPPRRPHGLNASLGWRPPGALSARGCARLQRATRRGSPSASSQSDRAQRCAYPGLSGVCDQSAATPGSRHRSDRTPEPGGLLGPPGAPRTATCPRPAAAACGHDRDPGRVAAEHRSERLVGDRGVSSRARRSSPRSVLTGPPPRSHAVPCRSARAPRAGCVQHHGHGGLAALRRFRTQPVRGVGAGRSGQTTRLARAPFHREYGGLSSGVSTSQAGRW